MKKSVKHLIEDEEQAIRDYKDSEKGSSLKAKKTFKHIRPEEKEHKKELEEVKHNLAKRIHGQKGR